MGIVRGIIEPPNSYPTHHRVFDWLHRLMLDLDFLRLAKEPIDRIDAARLAEWQTLRRELADCCLDHRDGLAFGDAITASLTNLLGRDSKLVSAAAASDWFERWRMGPRSDINHCQTEMKVY